jgi:hypothetical protein
MVEFIEKDEMVKEEMNFLKGSLKGIVDMNSLH